MKKAHDEDRGVAELWLVDTETETVVVHRRSTPEADTFDTTRTLDAGDVLTTPLIPGFDRDMATLFDR